MELDAIVEEQDDRSYLNMTLMMVQENIRGRGERLTLPQWPVTVTTIVVGTPSPIYWFVHPLADVDHLAHSPSDYFLFSQLA